MNFPVQVKISDMEKLYKPNEINFLTSGIGKNMRCSLAEIAR